MPLNINTLISILVSIVEKNVFMGIIIKLKKYILFSFNQLDSSLYIFGVRLFPLHGSIVIPEN